MNIILGASGQVGNAVVENLMTKHAQIKAVVRNKEKAAKLLSNGIQVSVADFFDLPALKESLKDGDVIFVLTPEASHSNDVIGDTKKILKNLEIAIESSRISKIIGLSSMGAQHPNGTGNLEMSYLLEHSFNNIAVLKIFVRPAYYFSNWLPYLPLVKEYGVLPTFFPIDLKIPMISPMDVAQFVSNIIIKDFDESQIFEVQGPESYSTRDVAKILKDILNKEIEVQQIEREKWEDTIKQIGFSEDATKNLVKMIEAVIDGKAIAENNNANLVTLNTSLSDYFKGNIK
ncbi:MAG: NAD(P)H-binding protein [Ignavibacteriae bacterium]|nr:NAD(P)H-binding protein [Ignavibacteriota bacterium]